MIVIYVHRCQICRFGKTLLVILRAWIVAVLQSQTNVNIFHFCRAKTEVDFENFERRMVVLPPKSGNMSRISSAGDKVIFQRWPNSGSNDKKGDLIYFDLKEREEKTILKDVSGYQLSANGEKLLVRQDKNYVSQDRCLCYRYKCS